MAKVKGEAICFYTACRAIGKGRQGGQIKDLAASSRWCITANFNERSNDLAIVAI
ncbi:MAG: hypothetical protein R2865_09320 [Deinococcales bacterium]